MCYDDNSRDFAILESIGALGLTTIVIDHRLILPGDEFALLPGESEAFAGSVTKVKRSSGAARIVARELLGRLGWPAVDVPKSASGAPIWPEGVVGSLAHDCRVAIAAVALSRDIAALGVDIEPAEPLPFDLLEIVATTSERQGIKDRPYGGRLLFAAKEAVYKAVYPLDHEFLEHHDVEIDFQAGKAAVRNGRIVELAFCISTHLVAVAYIPASL